MSATLDTEPVARAPRRRTGRAVGGTDVPGRRRAPRHRPPGPRWRVRWQPPSTRALAAHAGDVLVFLPGRRGDRPDATGLGRHRARRRRATAVRRARHRPTRTQPSPRAPAGRRKVVLATSIAETSLTIEGVTVVVDAGWRRTPRLDAGSGMTRLATLPVTRAEADQRAGRAGRLVSGHGVPALGPGRGRHPAGAPRAGDRGHRPERAGPRAGGVGCERGRARVPHATAGRAPRGSS